MSEPLRVIGKCPYCHRDVNEDLRPINKSRIQLVNAESAPLTAPENEPSHSNLLISQEPAANLTDNLLNMLEHEFERSTDEPSQMTESHAEVLVAILKEEDFRYVASSTRRKLKNRNVQQRR